MSEDRSTQINPDDDADDARSAATEEREHVPVQPNLDTATPEEIAAYLEDIAPADAASLLATLLPERAGKVSEALDPDTAAEIFTNIVHSDVAGVIITAMNAPEASLVLQAMDPDDRVDLLEHVTVPLHDELLREMAPMAAAEVRQLEQYPPDTAGGIMTTQVTALFEYLTVENAITMLRRLSEELEQMFYVYVVDRRQHLVGVLSMRDLILARPGRRLREIMIPNVRAVPVTMDQEHVAQLMQATGFLAVPVVDDHNRLVGLITMDDVVDVIQQEATEDVQRLFGAGAEERLTSPWLFSFRKRIGWLEVNLFTAFVAASVVGVFEGTIAKLAILAAYMPIVAGMGGNASAQAMAVAIRGIARGEVSRSLLRQIFHREFRVGLTSGAVIGSTCMIVAWILHHDHGLLLGVVVGLALLINHTLACVWGVAIPFLMKRLGFDPAQSATIFTTTLTDMVGFFTLLGLATLWMRWLH